MELKQKQINYYKKWERKRRHKLKYLLTEGVIYWALPFSVLMILFELNDNRFIFSTEILIDFIIILLIASILGILTAFIRFKNIEKKYFEIEKKNIGIKKAS